MMSFWLGFSYIKKGIYLTYQELGENLITGKYSTDELTLITNNMFLSVLFLFGFPIMLYVCTKNISNQDYRNLMKNFITFFMLFIAGSMAVPTLEPSNLTAKFYGTFIFLLVIYIALMRANYLMRVKLLMSLGIVKTQRISLFWKNSLDSIIWQPDSLIFLNKKWLPFVTVTMSGTSETILDSEWKQSDTSTGYTIKIESCLSGVSIQMCISSPFVIEREIAFVDGLPKGSRDNDIPHKEQLKYFETNNITEESLIIGQQRSSKMEQLEITEYPGTPDKHVNALLFGKTRAGKYRLPIDELRKEENNG